MLESTEKGGVRNSIRNCLTVFQNDPLLSGAIAKNLLTERTDIIKPIGYHRTGTAITDTDMNYLLLYLEETYGLTSEKKIAAAIGIVANENGYHPIRDYLNGLTWDGTERIRTCLHHFLGADSDQYTYEALRLFLLGAIHRAFHPGCKFEVMLCLVGGQGAGKSTLMNMISGFIAPTSGKIFVLEKDISSAPIEAKSHIGFLSEGSPLYPDLTVREFLNYMAELRGFAGEKKKQHLEEIIKTVGYFNLHVTF